MAVPFPDVVLRFFEIMLSSHGEIAFFPNFFETKILDPFTTTKEPHNDRFEDYGWTNTNFLLLAGRKLGLWLILFGVYPFIYYMKKKFADKHRYCKIWTIIDDKYKYSLPLRGLLMSYISMYLAAFLNVYDISFHTKSDIISAFSAITGLILLSYFPILLMNIL